MCRSSAAEHIATAGLLTAKCSTPQASTAYYKSSDHVMVQNRPFNLSLLQGWRGHSIRKCGPYPVSMQCMAPNPIAARPHTGITHELVRHGKHVSNSGTLRSNKSFWSQGDTAALALALPSADLHTAPTFPRSTKPAHAGQQKAHSYRTATRGDTWANRSQLERDASSTFHNREDGCASLSCYLQVDAAKS